MVPSLFTVGTASDGNSFTTNDILDSFTECDTYSVSALREQYSTVDNFAVVCLTDPDELTDTDLAADRFPQSAELSITFTSEGGASGIELGLDTSYPFTLGGTDEATGQVTILDLDALQDNLVAFACEAFCGSDGTGDSSGVFERQVVFTA